MEKSLRSLVVLIPAYKPGDALVTLAKELIARGFNEIVIVDDGSGPEYAHIFEAVGQSGCRVLRHEKNMGKGRALKTGMRDILEKGSGISGVITADADGQHLVKDIVNVGLTLLDNENTLVLGKRTFAGKVPLKSRFGNTITRHVFNFVSGQKVHDTQTGLRGIPFSSLGDMLTLRGDRYEYEMDMLLEAKRFGLRIVEVDIETVYLDKNNTSSHFNAFKDSWLIYRLIILFSASSIISFVVDYSIAALITFIFPETADERSTIVWIPLLCARLVSSVINFSINRNVIFARGRKGNLRRQLIGYYTLAAFVLLGNIAITSLCKGLGINIYLSIFISFIMFVVSFPIQKRYIFK
jgi:glycosyltransferase involved in cell wall biosynthesis